MGYLYLVTQLKKLSIILLIFIITLPGCSPSSSSPNITSPEKDKTQLNSPQYLTEANSYTLKEVEKISDIPLSGTPTIDEEQLSFNVINAKANIMVSVISDVMDTPSWTRRIYTYDFKNDELKKVKDYEENVRVIGFVEYEGAYIYAYISQTDQYPIFEVRIVEERDGIEKELFKSHIENFLEFIPMFYVVDNTLYFMVSDLVPIDNDYENAVFIQKLYAMNKDTLSLEFESKGEYKNYQFTQETDAIKQHVLYTQPQGGVMFQQTHSEGSTLHYKEKDEWKTFELPSNNEYLRSYIGSYVILYEKETKDNILLDLKTGDRKALGNEDQLWYPRAFLGGTSILYNTPKNNTNSILMLQEDGTVKTQIFNLLNELNLNEKQLSGLPLQFGSDGTNVLCGYSKAEFNDIQKGKYFIVNYPEITPEK